MIQPLCKPKPCKAYMELPVRQFSQGKTCFHYREPLFSLQGSCIHYRDFPVRITTQGNPCSQYKEWVCSEVRHGLTFSDGPAQMSIYSRRTPTTRCRLTSHTCMVFPDNSGNYLS